MVQDGKFLVSTANRIGQGPEDYLVVGDMDITDDGLISIDEGVRIREYDLSLQSGHGRKGNNLFE